MASRSEASTALPEPSKGLSGIVAADTTLSFIDGEKGILKYCGYGIDDLAASSSFEEVVCLLYDRSLPSRERLAGMRARIGAARVLLSEVKQVIEQLAGRTSPTSTLRTVASALGHYYSNAPLKELPPNVLRLVVQVPAALAMIHRVL